MVCLAHSNSFDRIELGQGRQEDLKKVEEERVGGLFVFEF